MRRSWLCLARSSALHAQAPRRSRRATFSPPTTPTQLSPHVWMIKGSPNIGIVVGKTGDPGGG